MDICNDGKYHDQSAASIRSPSPGTFNQKSSFTQFAFTHHLAVPTEEAQTYYATKGLIFFGHFKLSGAVSERRGQIIGNHML